MNGLIFVRNELVGLYQAAAQLRGVLPFNDGMWPVNASWLVYGLGLGPYLTRKYNESSKHGTPLQVDHHGCTKTFLEHAEKWLITTMTSCNEII